MIPRWVDRYMGIPFVDRGSTRDGCNCWGLVALLLRERGNIVDLDCHAEIGAEDLIASARAMRRAADDGTTWHPIDPTAVRPLDVVLMRSESRRAGRISNHVGVMVSESHVIHIERGIRSQILPLDHRTIVPRIVSFHRHRSLA